MQPHPNDPSASTPRRESREDESDARPVAGADPELRQAVHRLRLTLDSLPE